MRAVFCVLDECRFMEDARNKFLWFATDEQLLKFIHLDIKRPYWSLVTMQMWAARTSHQRLRKKLKCIYSKIWTPFQIQEPKHSATTVARAGSCYLIRFVDKLSFATYPLTSQPFLSVPSNDHGGVGWITIVSDCICVATSFFSEVCLRAKNSTDT